MNYFRHDATLQNDDYAGENDEGELFDDESEEDSESLGDENLDDDTDEDM